MFTGIIQATGTVHEVLPMSYGIRLVIDRGGWVPAGGYRPGPGDSIAVSGVCLTVADATGDRLEYDVIPETLAKTTAARWRAGDRVNLEPAVLAGQPMGGHVVQGHVDGVGEVTHVSTESLEWRVTVRPPRDLMDYVVEKGSIALDGVSLTIAATAEETFEVALIPTTLQLTTLGQTRSGTLLNIEADVLAKTIVSFLRKRDTGARVTRELLREAGFAA